MTEEGDFLTPLKLTPKDLGIYGTVETIFNAVNGQEIAGLCIERYVAYRNVMSPDSEKILMLIGAILGEAERRGIPTQAYRAIDWKIGLCKHLVLTRGFSNPSDKLDKKFSFAAQTCITGRKTKTDHEADAECLTYYGWLKREITQPEKDRNQTTSESGEVAVESSKARPGPSRRSKR